jgi:ribosomal protein S18 acetylase RimI-like enzyme
MNLTFERATDDDAEALVKVEIAAFHHDNVLYGVPLDGPPGYDSVDTALTKMRESDYYKIVLDGQIIGGMTVYDQGERHFHLDLIYINPAHHDRGIGSRAMSFLDQTYPAKKWSLDTPAYAIRNQHFYEKFGYVKVGETEYPGITLFAYERYIL